MASNYPPGVNGSEPQISGELTCNHNAAAGLPGLCPQCTADEAEDPGAFAEFGPHPAGEANWKRLNEEIAADQAEEGPPVAGDEWIPF